VGEVLDVGVWRRATALGRRRLLAVDGGLAPGEAVECPHAAAAADKAVYKKAV